jgi:arylsulfatase A-like enzyme
VKAHKRGSVSRGLVHLVDWYPTLLSLAGGCDSAGGDGGQSAAANGLPNTADKREDDEEPLDGLNQAEYLLADGSAPRTELIYNINDALRVTAAIR